MFGHSSGATSILNFLMDDRAPSVKAVVMIASFLEISQGILDSEWYVPGQFKMIFPENGFNWEVIMQKCHKFYFVHGSDDEYCSIETARRASEVVGGELFVVENGGHLGSSSGVTELPQVINALTTDGVL